MLEVDNSSPVQLDNPRQIQAEYKTVLSTANEHTIRFLSTTKRKKVDKTLNLAGQVRNRSQERVPGTARTIT
jgi:hypothetical protein